MLMPNRQPSVGNGGLKGEQSEKREKAQESEEGR